MEIYSFIIELLAFTEIRYQYYGDGDQVDKDLSTLKIYDCGLTIRSPVSEDYDPWKCAMHIKDDVFGSILKLDNKTGVVVPQQHKAISDKLYVQKGTPFTVKQILSSNTLPLETIFLLTYFRLFLKIVIFQLKCLAGQILDYCWFLSPNGTAYTVSKKRSSPTDLTYQGSGLEFGECGAVLEVADNSHDGNWSCHMGASQTTEMTARISVTVAGLYKVVF